MSDQLEIVHLRSFVVLAKELHYRKAAQRLFISQPGLSKRIRQMEHALGVQLVERHTRKVALTNCGAYLLRESENILDRIDRISSQLRIMDQGSEGEIRIGFVGSAMQQLIPELIMKSNVQYPNISFALEELSIARQIEALQSEQIDIGFVRVDTVPTDLDLKKVYTEKFSLALPRDHPVDESNFTGLNQFRDENFILFSSENSSPYYYNKMMSIFADAGFTPIVSNRSINANIIFKLVGNGFGVAIVPTSLAADFNLPIKLIELSNIKQQATLSIVWKKSKLSNLVKNVFNLITAP